MHSCVQLLHLAREYIAALPPYPASLAWKIFHTQVTHTVLPLVSVLSLLGAHKALKTAGKQEIASRCVTSAFYVIFFVYPSVSAKIFSTFNCVQFEGEFDGSDSWMRGDLTIDCNAPERAGWLAYAGVMSQCAAFKPGHRT